MSWTPQDVEVLTSMWGHGHSASEIAKHLGNGMTRNAVIGKAHRLKLSAGGTSSVVVKRTSKPSASMGAASLAKSAKGHQMLRSLPFVPPPPASAIKTLSRPSLASPMQPSLRSEGVSVTKVSEHQCRWPIGDPRSRDFRFCGSNAHEGMPYCVDHVRVAYHSISKRQRQSNADSLEQRAGNGRY